MSSGDEYDAELMSTKILEYIRGSSQSCHIINGREASYKIQYRIKRFQE